MSGAQSNDLALTDLDRELLKQCRDESFYRRSLPCSAALCLVTFWRHQRGQYQRYVLLRYVGSAIAGNILGRVSYLAACRKKFMDVEEGQSAVKAMLMKRQPPGSPVEQQQQQQQQRWQQQHESKRDISLDNQPMFVPDMSTPPPPPPPSPRQQQQQQPSQHPPPHQQSESTATRPDYSYGSMDDQYHRPNSNYYDDDASSSARGARMWEDDPVSKRPDS